MTARWLELCLDVDEQGPWDDVATFWAQTAGLTWQRGSSPGYPGNLVGDDGQGIALCPVPEPKTVKHRVHLDVHTSSVDEVVARGARVLDETHAWTVMADPDGGEFCAFVRDQMPGDQPGYKIYELCVDAADPASIAAWWAERFDVQPSRGDEPWWWLEGVPGMPFECIVFAPVPEPKTVKNRIHWDVTGDVAGFVDASARVLWEQPRWVTLADPEGNEFCVFPPG